VVERLSVHYLVYLRMLVSVATGIVTECPPSAGCCRGPRLVSCRGLLCCIRYQVTLLLELLLLLLLS